MANLDPSADGPFETERQVRELPAVQDIYPRSAPVPGWGGWPRTSTG